MRNKDNSRQCQKGRCVMGITAKELAKKLNLSEAAVSMALNGKPGVSTKTRKTVIEAAEQLGYDFTRISGRTKTTGPITFALYRRHGAIVADTPFFSELSEGIQQKCKEMGHKLNITYLYGDETSPLSSHPTPAYK